MKNFVELLSKEELESIIKNSNSFREALVEIGYKTAGGGVLYLLKSYLEEYKISISHFKIRPQSEMTLENIFVKNSTTRRGVVKSHIIKHKLIEYKCAICMMEPVWQGKKIILVLDHIDGDNINNEISNLRFLCPNCNSQTETFTGRNMVRKRQNLSKIFDLDNISNEKIKERIKQISENQAINFNLRKNKKEEKIKQSKDKEYERKKRKSERDKQKRISQENKTKDKELIRREKRIILLALLEKHSSLSLIGRELGISATAVAKRCRSLSISYDNYINKPKLERKELAPTIIEYYKECGSIKKTIRDLNLSEHTVRQTLKDNNIKTKNKQRRLNQEETSRLLSLLKSGTKYKEIAKELDLNIDSVKKAKSRLKTKGRI